MGETISVCLDDYNDYIDIDEQKEIVRDAFRNVCEARFRSMIHESGGVKKMIESCVTDFITKMVQDAWDEDLAETFRQKVRDVIEGDASAYNWRIFDSGDYSSKPSEAYKIIQEESKAARPLIKAKVEEHIANYPFNELDRDEISDVIHEVICERLFGNRDED